MSHRVFESGFQREGFMESWNDPRLVSLIASAWSVGLEHRSDSVLVRLAYRKPSGDRWSKEHELPKEHLRVRRLVPELVQAALTNLAADIPGNSEVPEPMCSRAAEIVAGWMR